MNLGIRGKTAVVGGASRGLGRAVCDSLAAEGVNLVMVARSSEPLEAAARQIESTHAVEVLPIAADLSCGEAIGRLFEMASRRFEAVDIRVHNTGGPPPGGFLDHDDGAWTRTYELLFLSVVRMVRGVLPGMVERGWGRILINTSFTVKEPAPGLILSNVFRTGVMALAKTLSREVAGKGITVNTVCPGAFATERLDSIFTAQAQERGTEVETIRQEWIDRIPVGRILEPHELGDLVAFLSSELASGMTGGCFPIEGGMLHGVF